jgi:predicted DsbA family dithiol-disulfide isomerase
LLARALTGVDRGVPRRRRMPRPTIPADLSAWNPMKIDFVSDIACPWCAVGLNSLERALDNLGDEVSVQLHFQPFELNPQMPPEGEDTVQHLSRK